MPTETMMAPDDQRRKANLRLGLVLGSVALAFFLGIIVKMVFLGR
jgi:hypothetical protein